MKKYSSQEIRAMWLNFFANHGHLVVPSKSLVPVDDESLLWINSGVATLKDYFTGKKKPPSPRLTNSQKSLRTNDIENVGVTARHHTFFEMLGNFAIGDYFKDEALNLAHELLFKVFKFNPDLIYITYFYEDEYTRNKWLSLGIKPGHLIPGQRKTNFWDVGQGPCGPCTEIFYDRGEKYDPSHVGIKLLKDDIENDRYVEIWNIVFSQFNNDGNNHYIELAQKNIDTGAGLERIVAVFQDAPTNFDTDLFLPIIHATEAFTDKRYEINNYFTREPRQAVINKRFRIIADHIRASAVAIQDGAKPSSTKRGYIIRRLIRRAYREGMMLGITPGPFLYKLVSVVAKVLSVYEIDVTKVAPIIEAEEFAFAKTIQQGEELLTKELLHTKKEFDFEVAYRLYETYGFPLELTQDILSEKGITLDMSRRAEFYERHAALSRSEKLHGLESQIQIIQSVTSKQSMFVGYDTLETTTSIIFTGTENHMHYTLLTKTPFYPTGGGQEFDHGTINRVPVINVFKDKNDNIWHVTLEPIKGAKVVAKVNAEARLNKERNHSATHLLGAALRAVFGPGVVQLGSHNNEQRLRFDFPLAARPSEAELSKVEMLVNSYIAKDYPRRYIETTLEAAKKLGALMLQDETYTNTVRVVDFGISKEFCGGTHVKSTRDIESFKITRFESKGSGVYRIEAVTARAVEVFEAEQLAMLRADVERLVAKNRHLDKRYQLEYLLTYESLSAALEKAREDNKHLTKKAELHIPKVNLKTAKYHQFPVAYNLFFQEPSKLRAAALEARANYPDRVIILGHKAGNKTIIAVTAASGNVKAIFEKLKDEFEGSGSGSDDLVVGSFKREVKFHA